MGRPPLAEPANDRFHTYTPIGPLKAERRPSKACIAHAPPAWAMPVAQNPAASGLLSNRTGRPHTANVEYAILRGRSSAGRASRSQCEGREFDPPRLHQLNKHSDHGIGPPFHRLRYPCCADAPGGRVSAQKKREPMGSTLFQLRLQRPPNGADYSIPIVSTTTVLTPLRRL